MLLKCKTCKKCFSETRGTVFFQLNTPEEKIIRTIAMIPEKGGSRGLARATGHSKDTICRWLEIAGTHSKEVTTYFFTNLNLNRVEVDEIWSYIKKQKNVTEEDPEDSGDVYSLTAIKSATRLLLFHHEGKRSTEDAIKLFNGVEKMRSASSPIPIFISDDWDAFEEELINVYGKIELPQYKGIGRKPLPKLVPLDGLKYVKVLKKKIKNYVVENIQRIIFGDPNKIFEMLGANSDDYISTSYVERINLTIRTSLVRFVRKTMNFSKIMKMHTKAFDLFQAWYNFIKPHDSLKLRIDSENRKWFQRTPAMAEGITDHIWSLKELLTFRVPVQ